MQVLQGTPAMVSAIFRDQYGVPVDPPGTITVTLTRADGTVLLAAGTATSHTSGETGVYSVTLTAAQTALLDLLTAVWVSGGVGGNGSTLTTTIEVVGGFYFGIDEARDSDEDLENVDRYSDLTIVRARRSVEVECERICGQAFVPRYHYTRLDGSGTSRLELAYRRPRRVRSLVNNGVAFTSDELATVVLDPYGELTYPYGSFMAPAWGAPGAVVVGYEHGWDGPPDDLRDAALLHLRHKLNRRHSGIPDRATSFTAEGGGVFSLATAGRAGYDTGIPDVDAVYHRYRDAIPAVA